MLPTQMKQRGFSLVETMVALGMMGTIAFGVMQFLSHSSDENLFTEFRSTQMQMSRVLMSAASKTENLRRSAKLGGAGNRELERCLDAGGPLCTSIGEGKKTYFDLFGANGVRIAGTQANPVNFDRKGAVCTPGQDPGCPFMRSVAYFWGSCPIDPVTKKAPTSCPQASSMVVKYEMTPMQAKYLNRPISGTAFRVSHRIFEDGFGGDINCPDPGTTLKGFLESGGPDCRCKAGYTKGPTIPNVKLNCVQTAATCPPGFLLRGRKADGTPSCIKGVISCKSTDFKDESAACPAGGWLENIDLGTCRPKPKGKKASDRNIQCDRNKGKCCRYVY